VVAVFAIGHLIWNWRQFLVLFDLFLGAAYAFHITLTAHVLKTRQTDITDQGYLFSAVVIFLGNISVLLLGIPLLAAKVDVGTAFVWWFECSREVFYRIGQLI
jgi:predicted permease